MRFLLALLVMAWPAAGVAQVQNPALERSVKLAQGVNLSHWLWLPRDGSPEGIRGAFTPADATQLRSLGLTHVRLPVEPDWVYDHQRRALRLERVETLKWAVDLLTGAGLAVVVDPHPARSPWVLATNASLGDDYNRFWAWLSPVLAATDPERVFLEIMNEPHDFQGPSDWESLQKRLAGTIRAGAPHHTIIATGDGYGSIDGLLRIEPLPDRNVIYSFHFYDPHTFTHQGATWGAANWRHLRRVPYPVAPDRIGPALAATEDERARGEIRWYGEQRWNAEKVRGRIDAVAAWADARNVALYCGEFGAYRAFTEEASRSSWLRDVTAALDGHSIGRAMWDYAGGFGLVEGQPGRRTLHTDTAAAIGLSP